MQRASGAKEDSRIPVATPEEKRLRLQDYWLECEKARRANPRDQATQRAEYLARQAMFDQGCQLQQCKAKPI